MIGFRQTSESKAAVDQVDRAVKKIPAAQMRASRAVAEGFAEYMRQRIYAEGFSVAPKKYPGKARDPRVLIDTKAYVESIKAVQASARSYGVQCDMQKRKFLEFGTRRQVARPHWRPGAAAYGPTARRIFQEMLKREMGL